MYVCVPSLRVCMPQYCVRCCLQGCAILMPQDSEKICLKINPTLGVFLGSQWSLTLGEDIPLPSQPLVHGKGMS